jgi:N-terminal domain of toast_rack, DUF2154
MRRAGVVCSAAVLLLTGCEVGSVATGEIRHETKSIEVDNAQTAHVEIRMGGGELRVKGGTPKLLEADFAFNVPEWKPVVDYRAGASRGDVIISQPANSGSFVRGAVYTWDLKLNDAVAMEVEVNVGGGEANLDLGRMNLRRVDVKIGAGELKMDLRGEPKRDYDVQIQGGVGQATVYLPRDAGIKATAAGGIGEISTTGLEKRDGVWVNAERIDAPVTVHLDVKGGVGEIRLVR